jgi:Zn-dependent protease
VIALKLGSIPLRVHGTFFIMSLMLGLGEGNPVKLALWMAIVLVSVVIHELGHALMGKAFGLEPSIDLHGMGGLTSFAGSGRGELGTAKSIAISLAGPFAGFVFAALVFAAQRAGVAPIHPHTRHAIWLLYMVNVGWGIFNLLPMLPLDGGNVLHTGVRAITKDHGERIARVISIAVAAGVALLAVRFKQWWVLYLGALFAYQNIQGLRQSGQLRVDRTLAETIEKAHAAFQRKEPATSIALLEPALQKNDASQELRQVGLRIYVIALLESAAWDKAMAVIERERKVMGAEDLARYARALRDLGRTAEAERVEVLGSAPAPLTEFRA